MAVNDNNLDRINLTLFEGDKKFNLSITNPEYIKELCEVMDKYDPNKPNKTYALFKKIKNV